MIWMTQTNSSGDPLISNLTDILDWEADSMSYRNTYYGHKEGKNDLNDSDEFIRGSSNIKLDRHIRFESRFEIHIEINIIDVKKAEMTWMTQMYSTWEPRCHTEMA